MLLLCCFAVGCWILLLVGLPLLGCGWFSYCDLGMVASGLVIWGLCCYVGFLIVVCLVVLCCCW